MEKARAYLIEHEEFYANLLYRMRIEWSERIPTAGISLRDQLHMIVNPKFWAGLSLKRKIGLLKHEMDHIVHGHILRGEVMGIDPKHMNLAADLAINEHNQYFKGWEMGLYVDKINEKENMKMEKHREMEYYAKQLVDNNIVQYETIDSHEEWDASDLSEEQKQEVMRQTLESAKQATSSGNVPQQVLETLNGFGTPKVPWKKVLRQFVQRAQSVKYKNTRNRRNRRTGLKDPGKRQEHKLNIACCVDTSGSVSLEELNTFSVELQSLLRQGVSLTIIEYDWDVQRAYPLKKNHKWDFKGRGGTNHGEALKHEECSSADCVFVFTDGDAAPVPETYHKPVLWVISGKTDVKPAKFGKVMKIET